MGLRQLSELTDDLFSRCSITAMLIGGVFWSEISEDQSGKASTSALGPFCLSQPAEIDPKLPLSGQLR